MRCCRCFVESKGQQYPSLPHWREQNDGVPLGGGAAESFAVLGPPWGSGSLLYGPVGAQAGLGSLQREHRQLLLGSTCHCPYMCTSWSITEIPAWLVLCSKGVTCLPLGPIPNVCCTGTHQAPSTSCLAAPGQHYCTARWPLDGRSPAIGEWNETGPGTA